MVSVTTLAAADRREFRFGLGHPVLEFVATRAARDREPLERLATPADLTRWLELSSLAHRARCDSELLDRARDLREAIYRTLTRARDGQPPVRNDLRLVNEWARQPGSTPQLTPKLQLSTTSPEPCRAALATLARSAIELIAGPALPRIRNCANPTCSLMFIDHSRPGRRRWCSMEGCGNRAKTARYRQRRGAPA
jgi:predicted RNA-binding Zn ribbon-like protein